MMESNGVNTYTIPTSSPEVIVDTPEITQVTQEALAYAIGAHEANPDDFDRRRTEEYGASVMTAAASTTLEQPTPEQYFSPDDIEQLLNCGKGVIYFRNAALSRTNVDLAA